MPRMYFELVTQMKKHLGQMDTWLEKATAFAAEKKFDANTFLAFRLAPDQFALARQVQLACGTAIYAGTRLAGKDAPTLGDDQKTLDDLRAALKTTVSFLQGLSAKDFEAAATRTITQPRWEGRTMTGQDYFVEHLVPNFFFHLAHTYAILRHNGVPLGKRDYLGQLTQRAPS
jgi:uncharacterized protein